MLTKKQVKLLKSEGMIYYGKGFTARLAVKSHKSKQTIYNLLSGRHVDKTTAMEIYDAGLELLEEAKTMQVQRQLKERRLFNATLSAPVVGQTALTLNS